MPRKRAIHQRGQAITKVLGLRPAEALPEGKVRCPGCGRAVTLMPNGRIRGHMMPSGDPCAQRVYGLDVVAELPPAPVLTPMRTPRRGANELPATGHCHDCDRPVSGERRFCGPCLAKRRL